MQQQMSEVKNIMMDNIEQVGQPLLTRTCAWLFADVVTAASLWVWPSGSYTICVLLVLLAFTACNGRLPVTESRTTRRNYEPGPSNNISNFSS